LEKRLAGLPKETWQPTLERSKRNLDRILEIQYQVEDIMENKEHKAHPLLTLLLDVCADELESLAAEAVGEGPLVERIRKRIDEQFGPVKANITDIRLHEFAKDRLKVLAPKFAHRRVEMALDSESVPEICIPEEVLRKVYDGLVKNAIENTPDGGKVEIKVRKKGEGSELVVQDYGIGITEENQIRIFEGFFTTQETLSYSSKRPFDFNAGGKGADLLRMKIFSERYGFKINMFSSRCKYIPEESDSCPGNVDACSFCETVEDCYESGGTTVHVFFPPVPARGCSLDEKV
jgi:signal transduction histidine kinase